MPLINKLMPRVSGLMQLATERFHCPAETAVNQLTHTISKQKMPHEFERHAIKCQGMPLHASKDVPIDIHGVHLYSTG